MESENTNWEYLPLSEVGERFIIAFATGNDPETILWYGRYIAKLRHATDYAEAHAVIERVN